MDGVHLLRKRPHTRLWYRAMPATAHPPTAQPAMTSGTDLLAHVATAAEAAAWEEHRSEPLTEPVPARPVAAPSVVPAPVVTAPVPPESDRQTRRMGRPDSVAIPAVEPVAKPVVKPAIAPAAGDEGEWRVVPATAPSLLLSATDLLDARDPGPVLRPGCRYRIGGVQNGIVGLYVADPDGQTGLGFCAAVDLICIDGRFHGFKSGRTPNVSNHPFRTRMQRLTGGLSQATTSLRGAAAANGSR